MTGGVLSTTKGSLIREPVSVVAVVLLLLSSAVILISYRLSSTVLVSHEYLLVVS